MKYKNEIKNQKGTIVVYLFTIIMFCIIVIFGIYINTNNKIQKQEQEITKIQSEYEQRDINDIYEETCNNWK